jgi:Tol biopolymer transport system component
MISRLTLLGIAFCGVIIASALFVGQHFPGRQMVYSALITPGSSDIFVLDVNLRLTHNLTQHPGSDTGPAWSPSGKQIVFESWRDGTRGVYVMNVDGSDLHRVFADPEASEYDPHWTADGRGIVFRSYLRGSSTTRVYRIRPDGTGVQSVPAGSTLQPASAPLPVIAPQFVDGKWGTYLTEGDTTHQFVDEALTWQEPPQWSADNRYIAFLAGGPLDASDVFVLTADGALFERITMDGAPKSHLRWRP